MSRTISRNEAWEMVWVPNQPNCDRIPSTTHLKHFAFKERKASSHGLVAVSVLPLTRSHSACGKGHSYDSRPINYQNRHPCCITVKHRNTIISNFDWMDYILFIRCVAVMHVISLYVPSTSPDLQFYDR